MKLNVGVIFGGKTLEHELSIVTAIQAMNQIDTDKYEITPIYVDKDLQMYTGGALRYIDTFKDYDLLKRYTKKVSIVNKDGRFIVQTNGLIKKEVVELHLALPIMHGANAEDGSIQGFLNIIGIPYVGSSIYSSVLAQDKVFMKQVMKYNDIPVTKFVWFGERFYRNKKVELFKQIDELKYPLVIKPATLGSSIGIEIIRRKEELDSTIERVFKYDTKIIIEEMVEDAVEYHCAVLLTKNGNIVSEIEEIKSSKEIIEYNDKILNNDKLDDSSIKRTCPVQISEKLRKEIELNALAVFKMLNMRGTARIDFLYNCSSKQLYVEEVNSIPWCYSHHLWEAKNISYKELLNIMLDDAREVEVHKQGMINSIDNDIIKSLTNNKIKEMK